MITHLKIKIKSITQKNYNEFIENMDIHALTCSCGMSGQLIKHAYYDRHIKTPNGIITLKILRVKCKCCNKTHAIFPECIVPYSQVLLNDHVSIIKAYNNGSSFNSIMLSNEFIDESNISYIIKQYLKYWKELIISFRISLDLSISKQCLSRFKRQFMQIKCTPNIIFS
ncbi:MAG: hypothetical protein Q607_CBUC00057G0047 [Clostridium butyricum DORA_1]|uniref:DUF6431 domain-containing protein n=1 Tax=Clostridium butyricum TaxID=1492 RepID=UPI0003D65571|nr:DUF6431 domain-containing protein [Clostridium butyricum]ETI90355.1 MAG: hypothetical protein Q607_CBUC00057G0047 [Clostridium butyricum DORA_1]MDU1510235.1 DUF6431 domain-containing protein [Clostridium butyricum]MDU4801555.1 DUF6431 domain-containing protein [Clostridium butyricum]NOW23301.1 hypothetical protein [Clostridium butyricum]NOW24871.1 hypothetical protein [Clostridium butyricum]